MAPLRSLLLGALALHASATTPTNDQAPLTNLDDYTCTHPPYKVTLVSKSPLVIYITDFLTPAERAHLLHITAQTFTPSNISPGSPGSARSPSHIRTSHSTLVPRDPLVRCLETRALLFQGHDTPRSHLEPLQLVRYLPSQRYHYHTDWFPSPPPRPRAGIV
ncbi:hypothetical protein B0T18DRAFT_420751 [Schizothecium vesticola]|uniref:Prolyl 4-hydroxylase alpha subunit domain-containing protein n=1 Tax=Schizothecium vesticola TaxID=314040 RepID=A0AA40BPI3_9PEZI|nr:hypothetical protein B0T18DRAFT_420751 [Schizothecium vesticola]